VDMQKLLSDPQQRVLSKRGSAVVDARTNTLFVQDTPTRLEEVRRLIQRVDIAVRQVMIESRIVEATDSFSRNLGVRLGYNDRNTCTAGTPCLQGGSIGGGGGPSRVTVGGNLNNTGFFTGQLPDVAPLNDTLSVNLPAPGLGGANAGVF